MDGQSTLYSLIIGMACLTYGLRSGKKETPPEIALPEIPKLPPEIEELIKSATAVGEALVNKVNSLEKEVKELKTMIKKTMPKTQEELEYERYEKEWERDRNPWGGGR